MYVVGYDLARVACYADASLWLDSRRVRSGLLGGLSGGCPVNLRLGNESSYLATIGELLLG